jgi:hypothetical protein
MTTDTPTTPTGTAIVELTSRGFAVIVEYPNGTRARIGTHTARYKARAQADEWNGAPT